MNAAAGLPDRAFVGPDKIGEREPFLRIFRGRDNTVPDLKLRRINFQEVGCALNKVLAKFVRRNIESASL